MNTVKGIYDGLKSTDEAMVDPAEDLNDSTPKQLNLLSDDGNPIPLEKIEAMKNYAIQLRRKHPHLTQTRLMKKVADYFKVKLV